MGSAVCCHDPSLRAGLLLGVGFLLRGTQILLLVGKVSILGSPLGEIRLGAGAGGVSLGAGLWPLGQQVPQGSRSSGPPAPSKRCTEPQEEVATKGSGANLLLCS